MTSLSLYTTLETLPSKQKEKAKKFIAELVESNKNHTSDTNKKKREFGAMKGKIHMSEDFDSPLDDFNDYM